MKMLSSGTAKIPTTADTSAQKPRDITAASRRPRRTRSARPAPAFCATKVANPLAKSCAGRVGKRVDFHACREGGHHVYAKAVDQALDHQNAEIHDGLLRAREHGNHRDAPDKRPVRPQVANAGAQVPHFQERIPDDPGRACRLGDHRRKGGALHPPAQARHKPQIQRDIHHRSAQQKPQRRRRNFPRCAERWQKSYTEM